MRKKSSIKKAKASLHYFFFLYIMSESGDVCVERTAKSPSVWLSEVTFTLAASNILVFTWLLSDGGAAVSWRGSSDCVDSLNLEDNLTLFVSSQVFITIPSWQTVCNWHLSNWFCNCYLYCICYKNKVVVFHTARKCSVQVTNRNWFCHVYTSALLYTHLPRAHLSKRPSNVRLAPSRT